MKGLIILCRGMPLFAVMWAPVLAATSTIDDLLPLIATLQSQVAVLQAKVDSLEALVDAKPPSYVATSAFGQMSRVGRQLSSSSCCRWTQSGACGGNTSEACTRLHEYLEHKSTTHVFDDVYAAARPQSGGGSCRRSQARRGRAHVAHGRHPPRPPTTSHHTRLLIVHLRPAAATPASAALKVTGGGSFTPTPLR